MSARTLVDWLERATSATRSGGSVRGLRLLDRREQESWRAWPELIAEAERVAGGLAAAGVSPGDRVALVHPTGWDFVHAFLGAAWLGAVPTPLYPPVRLARLDEYAERTAAMLKAARPAIVISDRRVRRVLGPTLASAPPPLGTRTLDELARSPTKPARPHPDDLALVQFSSGTTVAPKPVALSHRAIVAQVETLSESWPDDESVEHSGVSWLPLYHDMGLIGCLLSALQRTATLTLIPPEVFVARPAVWLRAISRYRATVSPAPNFAYALAADRVTDEELAGVDLSPWRVALDGAESVAPEVLRRFCERFAPYGLRPTALTPVYGLSEASLAVTFSALDAPFLTRRFDRRRLAEEGAAVEDPAGRELVSVGRPLPGFAVEIRGDEGETVPEGRLGTVWVRGPSLMSGYLDRPEETARALVGGWLDTGDTGFLSRGELFLTGRAKDLLIVRGRNHGPEEVEHPVGALAGVRPGCVVARTELEEDRDGEELWVFAERARSGTVSEPPSDGALRRAITDVALRTVGVAPRGVELLAPGALPRTSSGKLRRAETWRRYRRGELAAAPTPGLVGLAGRILRSEWIRRGVERRRDEADDG